MADRQKLIAVCLSQAHSFLNTGFLSELISAAEKDGYGVGIFSSSLDFLTYQKDSRAPRAGYLAIRYELFDALILIHHTFHDDQRDHLRGPQPRHPCFLRRAGVSRLPHHCQQL